MNEPMNEHEDGAVPGVRGLPMTRQPERDLWPGIAARITVRRNRYRQTFFAAAACALLALTAMLSLRLSQTSQSEGMTAPASFVAQSSPKRVTDLRANRALIKANLRLTQSAEGQVRKALRQSPEDPSLRSLLRSTEQQRRELRELLVADLN